MAAQVFTPGSILRLYKYSHYVNYKNEHSCVILIIEKCANYTQHTSSQKVSHQLLLDSSQNIENSDENIDHYFKNQTSD